MTENLDKINRLSERLEALIGKQEVFSKEIFLLRDEIFSLKNKESERRTKSDETIDAINLSSKDSLTKDGAHAPIFQQEAQTISQEPPKVVYQKAKKTSSVKNNLEKFIGENLINKIGIIITVIGVAIGAKYTIEHDLISPLTRIILGYFAGLGLLGVGMKLKKNYESYSAVLVSGAMAIMYFITYAAYLYYALFPQSIALVLMLIFTAFTVFAAINYNKQIIAHIGLVGAYAIHFLLNEGAGNISVLFSYMAIINVGILIIALKKYWKPLYYSSFIFTWLIYLIWFGAKYDYSENISFAIAFLSLFFVIFYISFLSYKLIQKEKFNFTDILLLLANSFVFYGVGYALIDDFETGKQLLGLFSIGNAIIHSVVSIVIFKQKLVDKNLFYFITGLVLVFLTIAIPVQLNGHWVTLLWSGEAALLFWIGRTKKMPLYEVLSYPLMLLAFISIAHDWALDYEILRMHNPENRIRLIFNINFLSSIIFTSTFGFICFINESKKYLPPFVNKKGLVWITSFFTSAILLIGIYIAIRLEISTYWNQLILDSKLLNPEAYGNYNLKNLKSIWIIDYSLIFLTLLSFANIIKLKNKQLSFINLALNTLLIILFLTQGLYILSEMRESYLALDVKEGFNHTIRYFSFAIVALLLFTCHKYLQQDFMKMNFRITFDFLIYISVLWILSSELIHWMNFSGSEQSYKLGLSILWGIYSLLLIIMGIWKKKKHLRIGAISIFAFTLLKLFFYDMSQLNTIAKTIVFVSLGVLLLIISFLYNKYKSVISNETEN